jgi:hypothetical protein
MAAGGVKTAASHRSAIGESLEVRTHMQLHVVLRIQRHPSFTAGSCMRGGCEDTRRLIHIRRPDGVETLCDSQTVEKKQAAAVYPTVSLHVRGDDTDARYRCHQPRMSSRAHPLFLSFLLCNLVPAVTESRHLLGVLDCP